MKRLRTNRFLLTEKKPRRGHYGEDVVQEELFEAYRKLDKFDESRSLKPFWPRPILAGATALEPATSSVTGGRSNSP